jgi:hypothetical protein
MNFLEDFSMHRQETTSSPSPSTSRRSALLLAAAGLLAGHLPAQALAAPATAPKKVLLVVRVEGKSLPVDQKIQQHLAARGYAVTLHSQYAPVEAALDADLVILSSTIRSHDQLGAYRNVPVPLLTWENDLLDDLAMTGKRVGSDFGSVEKDRYVWLVNAPHPMAAGLPAGVVDVYEKQAPMSYESLAPARRVMFFLDNETFPNLSPAGLKLFDAAVDWALQVR